MAVDTDVLVVGAGPIGLINAWGMKKLNPKLKIVVLEKYAEYQRSHTLVMQAEQLEAIMKATHSEDDPRLSTLLKQLKKDPHIRTNVLQQIFTDLAKDNGIEIQTKHEVKKEEIEQTIAEDFPNVRLIVGADGTHSVVSETLFPKGNQVKHEFDYVLQLRFEIDGEEKAPGIKTSSFLQQMARKGLIANEYVGHFDKGQTPVTMQMMITKDDFLALQKATSKDPIRQFAERKQDGAPKLPKHLKSFISDYLKNKIIDTDAAEQALDHASIRISVNEAPATHAKQIVTPYSKARVLLEGDAALGLSYFKGLNAGLEASAQFLTIMSPSIGDGFKNSQKMDDKLHEYESWFLNDFSPKKVKEVGQYSFWRIRSLMRAVEVVHSIKNASAADAFDDYEPALKDYFKYYAHDPLARNVRGEWRAFPHRDYDPIKFGQFTYVPLTHTAQKMGKIFVDYFKPYKSSTQIGQDFRQPLVGIAHVFIALVKTVGGIFTLNLPLIADGFFTLVRGAVELVTTPLTYIVKPITRGIATGIHGGYKKIEENHGLQHIAQHGQEYLETKEDAELDSDYTIYELLAVCNDLHRKFDKSLDRGQKTQLEIEEYTSYSEIRSDNKIDRKKLVHYFSLFAPKNEKEEEMVPLSISSKATL